MKRGHLACGNQAHAYAAMGDDKAALIAEKAPNIGIITAYNDMLSAHQPFKDYPDQIKVAAREAGNMVDLDSDPTKLIEIVEIGKALLMTRGSLTTFSIA